MVKVFRIIAGVIIGVAGAYEGADIASGGWLTDKLINLGKGKEVENDECDE